MNAADATHAALPERLAHAFFLAPGERAVAAAPAARSAAALDVLCFRAAGEIYGADIRAVQEVIRPPPLTALPRVRAEVLGIISLRGAIVPVIDLACVLGAAAGSVTAGGRIVILRHEGEPLGLRVDAVMQVARLGDEGLEPRPPILRDEAAGLCDGVGRIPAGVVFLLDVPALLARMESLA